MLALTRKSGESIRFDLEDGRTIEIKLDINKSRGKARFLIEAPKTVRIWREEIAPKLVPAEPALV